jgi:glycosyltransferase involved in cell wall biosynthesis
MNNKQKFLPDISIVVPVYDEEGNVSLLIDRLLGVTRAMSETFEIIFVDDGSRDRTWGQIEAACKKNHLFKGIRLSRNFGHQHALLAGLTHASGRAVISMDGDLQHPPEFIPQLIEKWHEGFSIVDTSREDVEVSSFFKRITSKYFYKIFSFMADVKMYEGCSDFRLVDRVVLDNLLKFKDVDLFLRGAVQWLGFRQVTLPYKVDNRYSGTSKYNLWKMLCFSRTAIISFSTKPLIFAVWIGLLTSTLAFIEIVYIIIQYLSGNTVVGWASTLSVLAFLFGVLFVILGIMGTYIARIHSALQSRPRFVADKTVNLENDLTR